MKGIKIELLGIAIIPLGIAVTTNNFWGYVLGVLGFGVAVVGCFLKDNRKRSIGGTLVDLPIFLDN